MGAHAVLDHPRIPDHWLRAWERIAQVEPLTTEKLRLRLTTRELIDTRARLAAALERIERHPDTDLPPETPII